MSGPFTLKPLPWDESALEPSISARTIGFHYGKHHKAYVDTLNKITEGTRYADMPLEKVVQATHGASAADEKKIFNNAGQVWNHDFYWRSLSPKGGTPGGKIKEAIERDFGSVDDFGKKLADAGVTQFGSGWAWLTSNNGKLAIEKTANAENPMAKGVNCLLVLDVWEHAYYLDYQNARAKYLETVIGKLNWDYALDNLGKEAHPVRPAA